MLKRGAFVGAIAALTIWSPSHAVAQEWGGGWGGGVTVTVSGFPGAYPYRRPWCCRPYIPRPGCCRPYIPRPVWCCNRPYPYYGSAYPYYGRPLYYYGDSFAPYGYNWNAGYAEAGYGYGE
jgi:hypothetical protein